MRTEALVLLQSRFIEDRIDWISTFAYKVLKLWEKLNNTHKYLNV